ncbi:hypothetical protein HMF3257_12195 [Spirosoma telluris]|uniref:Uncharacterized protein n=1 Tax=Spirosoma telluris TaxID=2183553 RepID=A0A327NI24_9BACT|nr:hypothetical protein HMF3257_12195 [Spirosoma telluris]
MAIGQREAFLNSTIAISKKKRKACKKDGIKTASPIYLPTTQMTMKMGFSRVGGRMENYI